MSADDDIYPPLPARKRPDDGYPPTAYGAFQRMRTFWLGPRVARLEEQSERIPFLVYLLTVVQSLAVLFVFAHTQLVQLLTANWTIKIIAGMVCFVFVITVIAADLGVGRSWRRIPALRRNRSDGMVCEHWLYILFVLALESSTLGLVIVKLEQDPNALLSNAPLIPADGWPFRIAVGLRLLIIGWTTLQLLIVSQKLGAQWPTLAGMARELLGGRAEQELSTMRIDSASLGAIFRAFGKLSKPKPRYPHWWNEGWIKKDQWQEKVEERQREEVIAALEGITGRRAIEGPPEPTPPPAPTRPTNGYRSAGPVPSGFVVDPRDPTTAYRSPSGYERPLEYEYDGTDGVPLTAAPATHPLMPPEVLEEFIDSQPTRGNGHDRYAEDGAVMLPKPSPESVDETPARPAKQPRKKGVKSTSPARNVSDFKTTKVRGPRGYSTKEIQDYMLRTYHQQISLSQARSILTSCATTWRRTGPGSRGRPTVAKATEVYQQARIWREKQAARTAKRIARQQTQEKEIA